MIESTIPSQSPRQGPSQILSQGPSLDKAPRLSISIVIWILSSDTICQLNQFNTNSEAAMLSSEDQHGHANLLKARLDMLQPGNIQEADDGVAC